MLHAVPMFVTNYPQLTNLKNFFVNDGKKQADSLKLDKTFSTTLHTLQLVKLEVVYPTAKIIEY